MEIIVKVYLTKIEIQDIIKQYPTSIVLHEYEELLTRIEDYIYNGYLIEIYYEDNFIVTMQDILSRFNQLEYIRTYRIVDKMLNDFDYIYKPGGTKK